MGGDDIKGLDFDDLVSCIWSDSNTFHNNDRD